MCMICLNCGRKLKSIASRFSGSLNASGLSTTPSVKKSSNVIFFRRSTWTSVTLRKILAASFALVGDILWVRETWSEWTDGYVYKAWTSPFPQPGNFCIKQNRSYHFTFPHSLMPTSQHTKQQLCHWSFS